MAYKDPYDERARAARRKHYDNNKDAYIERAKAQRTEMRRLVRELKEAAPCTDCGQWYPYYVMQFDHVSGDKSGDINRLTANGNRTKLFAEIEKCELVCSNCHATRTWSRLQDN